MGFRQLQSTKDGGREQEVTSEVGGFGYYAAAPLHAGDNIEELFTRVAVVAFENVLMKEIEAASSPLPSNGQLSTNSTLIGECSLTQ